MKLLNIETSTRNCSVSVSENGQTIAYREIAEVGFSHAERLHVFIEEVLKECNTNLKQLSAIAISKGPGSYTGLRIGVSAAKGLCFALDIPLISVDTLAVLAHQLKIEKGLIIPMIDARRMEVYCAVFDKDFNNITKTEAVVLEQKSFMDLDLRLPIYFIGDCNDKAKTVLDNDNFVFLDNHLFPSAKEMSALSYLKFNQQVFEDLASFEPFYLKDFLMTTSNKTTSLPDNR